MIFRFFVCFFAFTYSLQAQTLADERKVDWSHAGNNVKAPTQQINFSDYQPDTTGRSDCADILTEAISVAAKAKACLVIPPGKFLLLKTITLPSFVVIKGAGSSLTHFIFDLKGSNKDCFSAIGKTDPNVNLTINPISKGQQYCILGTKTAELKVGDWVKLQDDDLGRVTSDWAKGTIGQINQIESIKNDTIYMKNEWRLDFSPASKITKLIPVSEVGLECFSIYRVDSTATQTSNILLIRCVDSWVEGIESRFTNFAHVCIQESAHIKVQGSYFNKSYGYGGGGRAYGVSLQISSGDCLVENNIFEHLRHSILLQAGANGNVLAYNYSFDPYWTESFQPNNSSGDLVLHGNYTFCNLFEGNIVQNIVVDASHGLNGPFNTFFRNRSENYGIFVSQGAADQLNIIGNEITAPQGLYLLLGNDHFQYGNNKRGTILPSNTTKLYDVSYYLNSAKAICRMDFSKFPPIGIPQLINSHFNAAFIRNNNQILSSCNKNCTYLLHDQELITEEEPCADNSYPASLVWLACTDYTWLIDGGKFTTMPVHHNALIQWNLVDSGTITVILANEEKGCYGTVSKKVKIKNCTDTKEKGFEQDIFKFSPFGTLYISEIANSLEEYEMKIFDIYGRMIKQIRFNTIQKEIDLNLIPGIYHSIISSKNNKRSKQTSFLILSR